MTRRYATELSKLSETLDWAATIDISPLRRVVRSASVTPLLAIGSGGSLTAAHALIGVHQYFTGQLGSVATPLEAAGNQLGANVTVWLLSAGGGNVDALAAARTYIEREPRQLVVLCGRGDSALAALCRNHRFVDLLIYPPPAGKDGFLATNSLLGFTAILTRTYATEFGAHSDWKAAVEVLAPLVANASPELATWELRTASIWHRPTTIVLYGASTRVGAIDIESKFTEAALGNVQLADYRNFAHGRHHWLAKRSESSAVLALIGREDRALAARTLNLIPSCVPQAQIEVNGPPTAAALVSLVAALRITGWAGAARGIDPGKPGVPDFGRKLYHLSLPRAKRKTAPDGISTRDAAAITRKAGETPARLAQLGQLDRWRQALNSFRDRLLKAAFAGIVLDYDGTIVDTRCRSKPACESMAQQLIRIAESDARLAVATGRGVSVRKDLQARLPKELWPRVLVGYYNGAEIATLDNDDVPDRSHATVDALAPIAAALRANPEIAHAAVQTDRRCQITLEARRPLPENRLWDLAHQVLLTVGTLGVNITRSSHSIDILANGVSKLNVVAQLRDVAQCTPILAIGDRGRWPGNDYELLREEFALSVDEVSLDPTTCWNLASMGQRGIGATLDYLAALKIEGNTLRFDPGALR